MTKGKTIIVDGEPYVRQSDAQQMATNTDGLNAVIVRGDRSGVFIGYLKERNGTEVTLVRMRRLWSWSGAASISQLAVDGVSNPDKCKFPCVVAESLVLDAIEIVPATEKAVASIYGVPVWAS